MTPLDRLRKLESAATDGPWERPPGRVLTNVGEAYGAGPMIRCGREADAALIAESRNALPDLLALAEAVKDADVVGAILRAHQEFCVSSDNCTCYADVDRIEEALAPFTTKTTTAPAGSTGEGEGHAPESDVVLGHCRHGVDLDREFCPEGCRL